VSQRLQDLNLTGAGGLIVLLLGVALAVVLDVPAGPTGWRRASIARWLLLLFTVAVVALAVIASYQRMRPT
jgi:hypothetical protein